MTSKHATRAQTPEKSSVRINQPVQVIPSQIQYLISITCYQNPTMYWKSIIMPTFKAHFHQPSKTKRNTRQQLRQLPAESDGGSLFPTTSHNQSNHQFASQNVHDFV